MRKTIALIGTSALILLLATAAACSGPAGPTGPPGPTGPAGPQGPAGPPGSAANVTAEDLTCTQCHNDSTTLLAKTLQWERSLHATGTAYLRSSSASCAGCHSSEGFVEMVSAGLNPREVEEGQTNPTPPNCRTCHQIHETFTESDWALRATDPFTLFVSGADYDFGQGNLCANCHQPRRAGPSVGDGEVEVDSIRWGPHHGPQSTSFVGVGGYDVESTLSPHYQAVAEGCPTCHMINATHDMTPDVATCVACHADATSLDVNGVQTRVEALLEDLRTALETRGLLEEDHPVPGTYPEGEAGALWNYLSVLEDGSLGVHHPAYLEAMLQAGLDALGQ